jgi:hypothetical protein
MVDTGTPFSLNTQKLEQYFIDRAIVAVDRTAVTVLAKAKKYAPVRSIFAGTTFRTRTMSTMSAGGVTMPIPGGPLETRQPIHRRVRMPGPVGNPNDDIRSGHPNSSIPVFTKGKVQLVGDFRQYANVPKKRGELVKVQAFAGARGQDLGEIAPQSARGALTVAGRYEVRSGRALYGTPGRLGPMMRNLDYGGYEREATGRIGGRLKAELFIDPAKYDAGHVWAYVVSPTKDPVTGYPYPRAQEFGSSHNKPHPFLRPALYESQKTLVANVQRSVKAGPQE